MEQTEHNRIQFSLFTKAWKNESVTQLGQMVSRVGFDGIEFPVREGYQVVPEHVEKGLPQLVNQLADYGVKVFSVAGSLDEPTFAACAEAGVPLIRTMLNIDESGYAASIERARQQFVSLLPLCEKYGVKVGIQQHHGNSVIDSVGLHYALNCLDERHIVAVWDAAHDALCGREPKTSLDIVWPRIGMVNLKNAHYQRVTKSAATHDQWERRFVTGRQGMASWPNVMNHIQLKGYQGIVCLTAQYDDETQILSYIEEDLAYAKSLIV